MNIFEDYAFILILFAIPIGAWFVGLFYLYRGIKRIRLIYKQKQNKQI